MKFFTLPFIAFLVAFFAFSTPAHAVQTVPYKMNFQGRLADATGSPKADGTYNVIFRIYNSVGTSVWSESHLVSNTQGITVTGGLFSVQLGSITPLSPSLFNSATANQSAMTLEVELPTPATATSASPSWTEGAMTPRNPISTSAYSFNSDTIDGIDGAALGQLGAANTWTNTNSFTGAVTVAVTSANALQVQNAAGTTTYLNVDTSLGKVTTTNLEISSGKTLSLLGDTRTNVGAIASPVEGMMTYDTTNKQLLVYANGKWQADRSTATKIVGADNSLAKDGADYVVSSADETAGNADAQINAALTALPAGGGTVYLMEGTYTIDTTLTLGAKDRLVGSGPGTVIKLKNGINTAISAVTVGATSHGAEIRDLTLDGNLANNTAGNQYGVNVGSNGSATLAGTTITGVTVSSFRSYGIYVSVGMSHKITNSTILSNTTAGIYLQTSSSTVTGNIISSNGDGVQVLSSNNTISNNTMRANGKGIYVQGGGSNTIEGNAIIGSTSAVNGAGIDLWNAGSNNVIIGNTITGGAQYGIGLRTSASNTLVASNVIETNANAGIYVAAAGVTITGNSLYSNGGSTAANSIQVVSAAGSVITNNTIVDTAGTGVAIGIDAASSNTRLSGNVYSGTGATTITDSSTTTVYESQMNSTGQLVNSASGGLVSKLISGSSNDLIQAQDSTGAALMKVTSAGAIQGSSFDATAAGALTIGATNATSITLSKDTAVKVTSTTAFQVQNAGGTTLLSVDTSANTVTIGSATNGIIMSATGITFVGTARPTHTVTLSPEYAGAAFTPDGTANNGSLSSDFCSGSSRLNINATACSATGTHNYYQWTTDQATAQDYDIYVRYQIPSDYDTGSMTNLSLWGWGTTSANELTTVALYTDGVAAACATSGNAVTANAAWDQAVVASPLGSCTINAGDMVTFRVRVQAGQNNFVRAGEINFTYKKKS